MSQNYSNTFHTYPISSEDRGFEGSLKRFSAFPTPQNVLDYVMLGLAQYFVLTHQKITVDMVTPFLESAISEIEMSLGIDLSPVVHFVSEDNMLDQFAANYCGIRLQRWPATEIISVRFKLPHTTSLQPYNRLSVPPQWVHLYRNRLNIIAGSGTIISNNGNPTFDIDGVPYLGYSGYYGNNWRPGAIEVVYKAGFEQDKLPSLLADLIKTWAGHRFLADILPVLFPFSNVSVAIDSVSQSAGLTIQALLTQRIAGLEKKKAELISALEKGFGRQIKMAFLGA